MQLIVDMYGPNAVGFAPEAQPPMYVALRPSGFQRAVGDVRHVVTIKGGDDSAMGEAAFTVPVVIDDVTQSQPLGQGWVGQQVSRFSLIG